MKTKLFKNAIYLVSYFLFALLACKNLEAQVKISEQEWVIPTYKVEAPDKNPIFYTGETYEGAARYVYPYKLNDVMTSKREDKAWKALILENEYIKLCVTPEIGGKVYYATDKTNDYNFVYKNDVVKPSRIGMLGAWVSGGIEWCVLHHHRASCFLPMDYELKENADGSKTIWIGETEPRQRMRWTIAISSFPGKSYFEAEVKIYNPTPLTNTFLYFANVAAHTNKDYQTIFPPSVEFATFHAKNQFTHWPFSTEVYYGQDYTKGVDISWWKNSQSATSFFAYDLKEDFMGGYDHGKETGIVHVGDHNVIKGAKLWEWGSSPRGQATEARLTEKAGPYVELMTGAFSDNQPDYSWIRPYEVKTFKQYWFPVKDIQGFKNANLNGAVNLEKRDENNVFLGYYSTQKVNKAKISLSKNGKIIFEKTTLISPAVTFTQSIKVEGPFNETDLSTEMVNSETNEVLLSYHPIRKKNDDPLPETVKKPSLPSEIKTVEELYQTGSRIQQFWNPNLNAMDYFQEALKRDPDDIRTNTAVGNIYLINGDYLKARSYLSRGIKRLTKDYTRPSSCEALYLEGMTLKALELYNEAIDTLYRATWDYAWHSAAYLELARISTLKGNLTKALEQVNEALSTNALSNSAICLKASLLRNSGDYKNALITLENILKTDPLDFRAANESYLIARASGDLQRAGNELNSLNKKMRDFDQNYLELAVGYLNDGLLSESEDILHRFKGMNPIVTYYLGYLQDKKGNRTEAEKIFKSGSELSVDYCFPFRLETIKILETALKYNPNDGKAWYYLGNILYDKQPQKAIEDWENAVKFSPGLAIAYRNLGWGYYHHYRDGLKAITEYEKALSLTKDEPIYYEELDALYEMSNTPVEKRLKLFEGNNEVVGKRDDSFVRQITVLTLAGEPEKAVNYLAGRDFTYREGNSRGRDIVIDAYLILGKQFYDAKNYQKALENFLKAQVPEEEANDSRSVNRNLQVDYYIGITYNALGNKSKAKEFYTLSASKVSRTTNYLSFYQGLSILKNGDKAKATEIFNSLVSDGDKRLNQKPDVDFFSKFGENEAENSRLSQAYLLKGLGYKGLGNINQAKENLKKSVELSAGNLWAKVELQDL
jgi:tetratricopeptide (TPR) repeat protein